MIAVEVRYVSISGCIGMRIGISMGVCVCVCVGGGGRAGADVRVCMSLYCLMRDFYFQFCHNSKICDVCCGIKLFRDYSLL